MEILQCSEVGQYTGGGGVWVFIFVFVKEKVDPIFILRNAFVRLDTVWSQESSKILKKVV